MIQYYYIYITFYIFFTSFISFLPIIKNNNIKYMSVWLLFCLIIFFNLIRNIYAPTDAYSYLLLYKEAITFDNVIHVYHGNIFFSFLMYLGEILGLSYREFIYCLFMFNVIIFYLGIKLIFDNNVKYISLTLGLFILTSSFVFLYCNILRQGLAFSLFVLTIGFFLKNFKILSFFTMILSIYSHFSIIPIFFILLLFNKILKYYYKILILILPFLPIIFKFLVLKLGSVGGILGKITEYYYRDYDNYLVYIKIVLLYIFLIISYIYGKYFSLFSNRKFLFIFNVYFSILLLVFIFLPVLLISSRYIYYASGLIPILISFIFFNKVNLINFVYRYIILFLIMIMYGTIVYIIYPSTKYQLM